MPDLVEVYGRLAARCDYPLHLGLTEAGMGMKGQVASAAALSILLAQGIGDTIRVSLTPKPNGDRIRGSPRRTADPSVARPAQLRAAGHRVSRAADARRRRSSSTWRKTSRPTCASRCRSGRRRGPASKTMNVAVMGCVVNGPGRIEARQPRHLAARHVRGAKGAGLHGRQAPHDAQGRSHRAGVPRHSRGLRRPDLSSGEHQASSPASDAVTCRIARAAPQPRAARP